MSDPDRDVLITRYLDGDIRPEEVRALNDLLKGDREARSLLRAASFQALTLADLGRGHALHDPRRSRRAEGTPRWNVLALIGAAALLLIGAWSLVWLVRPERSLLTVVRSTGAISWSAEGGSSRTDLEPGTALGPGTLILEGARSSVDLRFEDGSSATLAGDSEVSFPGGKGKGLFLRRGSITVELPPRPVEHPMVLCTPTAEVDVVGTCFTLSAQSGQTMVTVGTGRVRLRRLVDGAVTDVPEGWMAVATLDASAPLESRVIPPLVSRWRQDFDAAPPAIWQGKWIPADATGPGRLKNVLDVSYRQRDGTIVPAQVVSARDPSAFATVRPDSVLRVKWRVRNPSVGLLVLLSLLHPDGRFSGNFQTELKAEALPADANGWRVFSAPISTLEPRYPAGAPHPVPGKVTLVFLACYSPTADLEVAEVAFE